MIRFKNRTPHFIVWGLLFLLVISLTFVSCGNTLTSWNSEGFKLSYDSKVFTVIASDSEFLTLELEDEDGRVDVIVSVFHPFALEQDLDDYFDAAQTAFQDEFDKITNNTKEDNLQFGVHDRRISLSGKHSGYDGVAMGLLRVMISDDTLLHVSIIGSSKTMMTYMKQVQEILNSAEIKE
ncbi:MAG: hypothetical protein R2883_03155 [Caldisericia bacterium]